MDYEKKYKEALGWMQNVYPTMTGADKEDAEHFFPELKESEDEKIRKALINFFDDANKCEENPMYEYGIHTDNIIAWLEKQGKQGKSALEAIHEEKVDNANKVEPKFKVGDWVVCEITGSVYQIKNCIENLSNHRYGYELTNGGYIGSDEVNHYHLWTIQDAKDGDVLTYKGCTFIFKKIEPSDIVTNIKNPLTVLGYCGINHIGFEKTNGWGDTANCKYHPATKEQRDTLFEKMKEAGYEWDAEKKELKKIEKQGKQKWSEEDEDMLESIICHLQDGRTRIEFQYEIDWLKSIKQRMGGINYDRTNETSIR